MDTTTYALLLVDSSGCISRDSVTINVTPFLGANLPNDTLICFGDSFFMAAVLQGSGLGNPNFTWLPSYNISDTSIIAPTVWPDDTTVYHFMMSDSQGLCSFNDSIAINVNPAFSVDILDSKAFICFGDSVQITTNMLGVGTLPYSISWTPTNDILNVDSLNV